MHYVSQFLAAMIARCVPALVVAQGYPAASTRMIVQLAARRSIDAGLRVVAPAMRRE